MTALDWIAAVLIGAIALAAAFATGIVIGFRLGTDEAPTTRRKK